LSVASIRREGVILTGAALQAKGRISRRFGELLHEEITLLLILRGSVLRRHFVASDRIARQH